jgi:hypothetical protein
MGFPTVHKWISALNITDKPSLDVLLDAQGKFEAILAKLTGQTKAVPKAEAKKSDTKKTEIKKEAPKAKSEKKCSTGGKCGQGKCGGK